MTKVSIIVPIYGVEKYIERCANSLLSQTYSNIEFIFVDDATKDNSIGVLESVISHYPDRKNQCVILHHEKNKGLSGARNTGVSHFSGDYLLHVDGDDYLEVDAVEQLVRFVEDNPSDIVIFDSYSVSENGKNIRSTPYKNKITLLRDTILKTIPPSIWNKMYSSRLYRSGYDTMSVEGINHGEDYATTPRLIYYAETISKLNKPLYNYVIYNEESYTKNITMKSVESMLKADEKLFNFFKDKTVEGIKISDILYLAKLRTKTGLLKRQNIDLYPQISSVYNDVPSKYKKMLSLSDRLLLYLIDLRLYKLACIYSNFGLKVARLIK